MEMITIPKGGRPKGSKNKQPRKDSKMAQNDFKTFFDDLVIDYLNHRFGDAAKVREFYNLKVDGTCHIRKSDVIKKYGAGARDVLDTFFSFSSKRPTDDHPGSISQMTLTAGAGVELYEYLKGEGHIERLRRDKIDGVFHSWVEMQEWKINSKSV